jgi:hypothetical protein
MKESFDNFIHPRLSDGFDWAGILHYPSPTDHDQRPENLKRWRNARSDLDGLGDIQVCYGRADWAANQWAGRVRLSNALRGFYQIKATERCGDFSVRFYFAFSNCKLAGLHDRRYLRIWRDLYLGKAYETNCAPSAVGEMLREMVMHRDAEIEIFDGDFPKTYRRSDFL